MERIQNLFGAKPQETFLSVDIGSSSIKLMEIDLTGSKPKLVGVGIGPTPGGAITNNLVAKPDAVANAMRALADAQNLKANKVVFGLPGPAVFTKKINTSAQRLEELTNNIYFEAGNYIPHKIEAVHLDFQVLRALGPTNIEVLIVAVKNEIIASFLEAIERAGLEPAIADVDYFALENMFELSYPEEASKTIALIDIGSRYSGVNILQDGRSLFTGDVGVGGRLYTDALCETLNMQPKQAEAAKAGEIPDGFDENLISETIDRTTEHVASELHRQLGFFWNAAATDRSIDAIYLTGGGAQLTGLLEELNAKTGIPCSQVDPFRGLEIAETISQDYLRGIASQVGTSVGLALRRFGDKKHAVN